MPFDLNILCCNQDKPVTEFPFRSAFTFDLCNKNKYDPANHYGHNTWNFINYCPGFWYYLLESNPTDESCACYDMCDIFYDDEKLKRKEKRYYEDATHYPSFFEYTDSLPWFGIKTEFRKDFEEIILYFIELSPVKMIIFLPRFQGEERDVIQGVFPKEEFFQMLDSRQVKFNHCYIIGNKSGIPVEGILSDDGEWTRYR